MTQLPKIDYNFIKPKIKNNLWQKINNDFLLTSRYNYNTAEPLQRHERDSIFCVVI